VAEEGGSTKTFLRGLLSSKSESESEELDDSPSGGGLYGWSRYMVDFNADPERNMGAPGLPRLIMQPKR
jgi:hypothetical protein